MSTTEQNATKFLMRFEKENDPMHQEAKERAKAEHMSLNSFIIRALDRDLNRGSAMDRAIAAAEKMLRIEST